MSRRWIADLGAWLLGLALFALIMYKLGPVEIASTLQGASVKLLLLSILVTVLASVVRLSKWYWVLHTEHSLVDVAVMFFSSKAFGALLPARVGEFAPVLSHRNRAAEVSALIIADRLLEVSATLCLGAWGILALGFRDKVVILSGTTITVMVPLLFALLSSGTLWESLMKLAAGNRIMALVVGSMSRLSASLRQLFHLLVPLAVLTTAAALLGLFQFRLFLQTVGVGASFPLAAAVVGVAAVASLVAFTPWGLGVVDMPVLYLATTQNMSPAAAGGFLVLARVVPIGLDWMLYGLTWSVTRVWRKL